MWVALLLIGVVWNILHYDGQQLVGGGAMAFSPTAPKATTAAAFATAIARKRAVIGKRPWPLRSSSQEHHHHHVQDQPSSSSSNSPATVRWWHETTKALTAATLCLTIMTAPLVVHADDNNDMLDGGFNSMATIPSTVVPKSMTTTTSPGETVRQTVQLLQQSHGNVDATLKAYEQVADIITEGTGVGGKINYQGIQLERGYVADEDTTLYNPGLSLLTESEKEALMQAVLDARREGMAAAVWTDNAELGYEFLKQNLDPWHVVELRGYLQILPWYGAAVYLAVLAVQQFVLASESASASASASTSPSQKRTPFTIAYFVGVAAVFGPALILVALGPQ
ncbi:hypothetical protein ACA910_021236 [Epithemia clementina (nom. ined.)]